MLIVRKATVLALVVLMLTLGLSSVSAQDEHMVVYKTDASVEIVTFSFSGHIQTDELQLSSYEFDQFLGMNANHIAYRSGDQLVIASFPSMGVEWQVKPSFELTKLRQLKLTSDGSGFVAILEGQTVAYSSKTDATEVRVQSCDAIAQSMNGTYFVLTCLQDDNYVGEFISIDESGKIDITIFFVDDTKIYSPWSLLMSEGTSGYAWLALEERNEGYWVVRIHVITELLSGTLDGYFYPNTQIWPVGHYLIAVEAGVGFVFNIENSLSENLFALRGEVSQVVGNDSGLFGFISKEEGLTSLYVGNIPTDESLVIGAVPKDSQLLYIG